MPRSLVSFWKRVAVSGITADGREISPQELREIAETYSPSIYTAVIWCDHERAPGSHGTVFAVRLIEGAEDLGPDQVALEAQLKPNDRLLWLNDQGLKLFTSIEITPNFAGGGKAYLSGLAVTDEPASLGTQELYFSKKSSEGAYYAMSTPLTCFNQATPPTELKTLSVLLKKFFKRFGIDDAPSDPPSPNPTEKTPMDEATATALKALVEQLLVVITGLQDVIEPIVADAPEPESESITDVETAVAGIVAQAEADREFARRGKTDQRLTKIETLLTKALSRTDSRQLPRNTGAVTKAKARVL